MPLTPRPLAPLALRLVEIPGIPRVRGVQAVGLARLPTLIRGGASPLRRAAEQHPAQHRDLLRQLRDPGIGLRERLLGPLGTLTPVRHISGVTGHRREGHVLQNTPSPSNTPRTAPGVSRTKPQPRRRPRLQTHAALTPHVTTGGHSDSARPPTGSPNTYVVRNSSYLLEPGAVHRNAHPARSSSIQLPVNAANDSRGRGWDLLVWNSIDNRESSVNHALHDFL